ncbi:MAG: hypothetical protein NC084_04110 [Bacteroides sp.]|nr:hypothetical protein [Eubacterium sp.]MCM1417650.1 hypothetical protein [Roseburia sp.]MCM1461885.1 hypothetical protein [Bacteroides sp.]
MYIYESHIDGSLYAVERELSHDELYCDQCGDSDSMIGYADTKEEARALLCGKSGTDDNAIREFLEEWEDLR